MKSFYPWSLAEGIVKCDPNVSAVGVRTFVTDEKKVFRVFYPALKEAKARQASWFRVSFPSAIDSYLHTYGGSVRKHLRTGNLAFEIVSRLLQTMAWFTPLRNARLPNCYDNLKPISSGRFPLLMWSHGLTGMGDENALLAAALAADGVMVALITHTDGSSSKVDFGNMNEKAVYYQHPDWDNYDSLMRKRQTEHRVAEVEEIRQILLDGRAGADLRDAIDPKRIAVGGFSFGAVTAAHLASTYPSTYRCALFVDGWFHIHHSRPYVSADQPACAFDRGIAAPCLFVGTEEFYGYRSIARATERLYRKCADGSESRMVAGTRHQNFADVVFWLPVNVLRKVNWAGDPDPHAAYEEMVVSLKSFLRKHCR